MNNRGSILVLALISVLVLSVMAIAGLTVSTTEIQTTDTLFLRKSAYYLAVQGVEQVRDLIYQDPNPEVVGTLIRTTTDTTYNEGGMAKSYITGSLIDLEAGSPKGVTMFDGFDPPPMPGISLGAISAIQPVVWDVRITSRINVGRKRAYSEIQTGVYSIVTTGY